jgi:hypothetical protein
MMRFIRAQGAAAHAALPDARRRRRDAPAPGDREGAAAAAYGGTDGTLMRFEHQGRLGWHADGATIRCMRQSRIRATGATPPLPRPCGPHAVQDDLLWNNFHALAARLGVAEPDEP